MKNLSSSTLLIGSALFLGLGLGAATGCGSTVSDDGDGNCEAYPSCDSNEAEVTTCDGLTECREVSLCGSTIFCQGQDVQCDAFPVCNGVDPEVQQCPEDDATCYEVTECGLTILCQEVQEECLAIPVCDDGDEQLDDAACPDDASCYQLEECGTTITCLDNGSVHGCPTELPPPGLTCGLDQENIDCVYDVGEGCFDVYQCEESLWHWAGGGCEGKD